MAPNAFSFQKRRELAYAELYLSDGADQRDHHTVVVQIELLYCLHTQSGQEPLGKRGKTVKRQTGAIVQLAASFAYV